MHAPTPSASTDRVAPPKPSDRRTYPRHRPMRRMTCLLGPEGAEVRAAVQKPVGPRRRGHRRKVVRDGRAGAGPPVQRAGDGLSCRRKLRVIRRCTLPGGEYLIAGELDRVLEPAELLPFLL